MATPFALAAGLLGTGEAISFARKSLKSDNLIERQNGIHGLAMADLRSILPYLNDDEMKVRQAVVEELVAHPAKQHQHALQVIPG
ncbi:MAG: hypothetical protein R3C11_21090 [Planctomycetaceae bacterium]